MCGSGTRLEWVPHFIQDFVKSSFILLTEKFFEQLRGENEGISP